MEILQVTNREAIERTIHTVAVRQLGIVDTSIVRAFDGDDRNEWAGEWFALSVRLPGDVAWKLLGRRRTREELLTLANTIAPRDVDGRDFRTCCRSGGGVGAR